MSDEEKKAGLWVPFMSENYCDDGILAAIDEEVYETATVESYKHFVRLNLGTDDVSDKDPEEQKWRCEKTVIGHKFSLGNVADERGDRDFLCPTTERVQLMIRLMDDGCFTPQGKSELTEKKCQRLFSLFLWMCIPCPRLKGFIGSFKRVLELRKSVRNGV